MDKKVIKLTALAGLLFTLTACPGRYFEESVCRQGAIHELGIVNPTPGIMVNQAQSEIEIQTGSSINTNEGKLQDVNGVVKSHYEIYNNLDETTLNLALPFTRSLNNDDEKNLNEITLSVIDNGIKDTYRPRVVYGSTFKFDFANDYYERDDFSFKNMQNDIEKQKERPNTVFEYQITLPSDITLISVGANLENVRFYFVDKDDRLEIRSNDKSVNYYITTANKENILHFYADMDFSDKWQDFAYDYQIQEVSYSDTLLSPLSNQLNYNVNLVHSLIENEIKEKGYFSKDGFLSNFDINDTNVVYLQNYMLYYTVPIRGNNASLQIDVEYPIRVERSFDEGRELYRIDHYDDGLYEFKRLDNYLLKVKVNDHGFNRVENDYSDSELDYKDGDYVIEYEHGERIIKLAAYYTKDTGCQSFKNGAKIVFGSFFVFVYLLIELGYRRKKHA